jgi:hypothetical protein
VPAASSTAACAPCERLRRSRLTSGARRQEGHLHDVWRHEGGLPDT